MWGRFLSLNKAFTLPQTSKVGGAANITFKQKVKPRVIGVNLRGTFGCFAPEQPMYWLCRSWPWSCQAMDTLCVCLQLTPELTRDSSSFCSFCPLASSLHFLFVTFTHESLGWVWTELSPSACVYLSTSYAITHLNAWAHFTRLKCAGPFCGNELISTQKKCCCKSRYRNNNFFSQCRKKVNCSEQPSLQPPCPLKTTMEGSPLKTSSGPTRTEIWSQVAPHVSQQAFSRTLFRVHSLQGRAKLRLERQIIPWKAAVALTWGMQPSHRDTAT